MNVKSLNKIITFILIFTMFFMMMFSTYCMAEPIAGTLVLGTGAALTGSTLLLVSGIALGLIALGVIFYYADDIYRAVENYYNSRPQEIKEMLNEAVANGEEFVCSDELYADMALYVDNTYSVNGVPINVDVSYNEFSNPYLGDIYYTGYGTSNSIIKYSDFYIGENLIGIGIINDYENGTIEYCMTVNGITYNKSERFNYGVVGYSGADPLYIASNSSLASFYCYDGFIPYYYFYYDYATLNCALVYNSNFDRYIVFGGVDGCLPVGQMQVNYGIDEAAFGLEIDWKDTKTGIRSVVLPKENVIENIIGLTAEDVRNNIFQEETVPDTDTGIFQSIWTWLQNFWSNLGDLIGSLGINEALTSIKTGVQSIAGNVIAIAQEDAETLDENFRKFSLPDLFILFLDVLLACIMLILRFITWLVTMPNIQATSALLNPEMISAYNFVRNQNIPVFNISLITLISAVLTFCFGLVIARKVKGVNSV